MKTPMLLAAIGIAAIAMLAGAMPVRAHKTVVSRFTYHADVLPILQARCMTCHVDGGVAPTSFASYQQARAQGWPMRQALLSRRMPPWQADGFDTPLKGSQALSTREFDVLMTWAAGGMPEGTPTGSPETHRRSPAPDFKPDAIVAMPEPFTLAAGTVEARHESTIAGDRLRGKFIQAVDLIPGAPSVVQRAEMLIRSRGVERVIGLWVPGDVPQASEANGAFQFPPDGSLVLRTTYRRPRAAESFTTEIDRSQVAVHFAKRSNARDIRSIMVSAGSDVTIDRQERLVALRPVSGPDETTARLMAISPDGVRTPLARLRFDSRWPRRYVLSSAIALARGTRLELDADRATDLWTSLFGPRPGPAVDAAARIAIDLVH